MGLSDISGKMARTVCDEREAAVMSKTILVGALIAFLSLVVVVRTGEAQNRGNAYRRAPSPNTVRVGQLAPDFDLVHMECIKTEGDKGNAATPKKNGGDRVKLSSFRGKKPVVLIFSSYT